MSIILKALLIATLKQSLAQTVYPQEVTIYNNYYQNQSNFFITAKSLQDTLGCSSLYGTETHRICQKTGVWIYYKNTGFDTYSFLWSLWSAFDMNACLAGQFPLDLHSIKHVGLGDNYTTPSLNLFQNINFEHTHNLYLEDINNLSFSWESFVLMGPQGVTFYRGVNFQEMAFCVQPYSTSKIATWARDIREFANVIRPWDVKSFKFGVECSDSHYTFGKEFGLSLDNNVIEVGNMNLNYNQF